VLDSQRTALLPSVDRPEARKPAVRRPVTVAIVAQDPITGQGAAAFLRERSEIRVLTAERQPEAEVVLILVETVTEATFRLMERIADGSAHDSPRLVLVGDGVREHQVLRAITGGLVTVVSRREADFGRVLRAVIEAGDGVLQAPGVTLGWMVGQLRLIQQDVLEPDVPAAAGLEDRELAVLKLLADGLGTPEIAVQLCYSERTVKNIIHGVLTRLRLRNRTQAVAYAVRCGAF